MTPERLTEQQKKALAVCPFWKVVRALDRGQLLITLSDGTPCVLDGHGYVRSWSA